MTPAAPVAVIGGVPISLSQALGAALALLAALTALTLIALWRAGAARRREREAAEARQEAIEERFAALAKAGAELNGRVAGLGEWLGSRQADLARVVADRLDSVGARLGAGLESQAQTTGESLGRLNERLAVIDAAQSRLTEMTREVVSLKDILANKQARGAFGQGRMEAIVRDGLPAGGLRLPVHALEPRPARLRHPSAGRCAAARRGRKIPARGVFGPARGARR
jgi:DNA recombination protein RmuC